jgi:outer membrane protein assembly factor BamD (BamD/ComL family)
MRAVILAWALLFTGILHGYEEFSFDKAQYYPSVQELYSHANRAYQQKNWDNLLYYSKIITKDYRSTSFASEAEYFLAVSQFYYKNYENANDMLTKYLTKNIAPKYFEEAITYKFQIAENYKNGSKAHLFDIKFLPRWMPNYEKAAVIFDEVISSLPHHDLAAKSLFSKAHIQFHYDEYREGIETLTLLIRRFPKHQLAIDGFVEIGKSYLKQMNPNQQNYDLLDLANVNLRKFKEAFPGEEEKLEQVKNMTAQMKEVYAQGLYEVGDFFERTKKPEAAKIYYSKILSTFPATDFAKKAVKKLEIVK